MQNEKLKIKIPCFAFFILSFALLQAVADSPNNTLSDFPVYISKVPNPNDYSLFANSGWDGNWYVGFNTCWIKQLPSIPKGEYAQAYIGARVGRAKLLTNTKNVWDKQPVPGVLFMAIASTTAWSREQSFFLTSTDDIPLEGDYESAVEGTGESHWFWTEVPMKDLNLAGDNFLALWSPTPELLNVSSSPVLAAAWGGKDQDTWMTHDIRGAPPRDTHQSIGSPISYFQPALAMKLIPRGAAHSIRVQLLNWKPGTPDHPKPVVTANINGDSIEQVWLEYFVEKNSESKTLGVLALKNTWIKVGRSLWSAPYILTIEQSKLPPGRIKLRVAAANIWEQHGYSSEFTVDVATTAAKSR